jgi:hypothetical protein
MLIKQGCLIYFISQTNLQHEGDLQTKRKFFCPVVPTAARTLKKLVTGNLLENMQNQEALKAYSCVFLHTYFVLLVVFVLLHTQGLVTTFNLTKLNNHFQFQFSTAPT